MYAHEGRPDLYSVGYWHNNGLPSSESLKANPAYAEQARPFIRCADALLYFLGNRDVALVHLLFRNDMIGNRHQDLIRARRGLLMLAGEQKDVYFEDESVPALQEHPGDAYCMELENGPQSPWHSIAYKGFCVTLFADVLVQQELAR
jgi:hypothetical protein